jgi:threonine dehydratase
MITALPVTLSDIEAAARVLEGQIVRTPMHHSRTLSAITGADVWVKFENHQFTAAFKERGALNRLSHLTEAQREAGVIAASAGNHSQGVAYHARRLGIPATIVMPRTTPFSKVEQTRSHGAKIVLHGLSFDEAKTEAYNICQREGLTFIHPFDDPHVMAGQGTIALEMLAEKPDLETLVVPIGGGGLIAGMAIAAKGTNPDIRIVGVETSMYPAMLAELEGREVNAGGATIAEGIAVREVGRLPLKVARELVDEILLVEEEHLEQAITLFVNVEKTIAEGAGPCRPAGPSGQIPRPEGRPRPLRRQYRYAPTRLGPHPCAGAGKAPRLDPHHRRRPARPSRPCLQDHRRQWRQYHGSRAQPARTRRAGQRRRIRHPDRNP